MEWKDWFVRHKFGPMTAIAIKAAEIQDLDVLLDYVRDIREGKEMAKPSTVKIASNNRTV